MPTESAQLKMTVASVMLLVLTLMVSVADRLQLLIPVRTSVHELLLPGQLLCRLVPGSSEADFDATVHQSNNPDSADQTLLRRLMVENARLRQEQETRRTRRGLYSEADAELALLQLQVVPAQVISSRQGMPAALTQLILDAGRNSGLRRSELVVEGDGLILDAGTDRNVQTGDRVLDGLTVVGRIERASRWISLVQPIHAEGFRAQVSLLRNSGGTFHFGASGILEGTGEAQCRLTGVAQTEAVAVGDEVVGMDVEGLNGPSLYFGTVTTANFSSGGQWEIRVRPAAVPAGTRQVGVLRWQLQIGNDTALSKLESQSGRTDLLAADRGPGR
ncbi:MAG: rod shape-determining protein MreC [Planctomycetaceae bacterium]